MKTVLRWTEHQFRAYSNARHHGCKKSAKAELNARGYTIVIYETAKAELI